MMVDLVSGRRAAWRHPLLLALAAAIAAGLAWAGSRDFWRFETSRDFLSGESDGVSIGPEGQVRLAPALRALHESEQPFVWSVASDGSGGVIAGGGAQGTLIRIRGSSTEVLADTGEVGIHAVAVASDGAVYFATAPGGSVQRILPGGERGVLYQPEARYIWALVPEPGGSLLVATGMPGSVIRVQPSGSAETIFTTTEENVTALQRASDGTIYLGTEPSGIVFRIDGASGAMALYDSPLAEIRALALDAAGDVFAAAVAASGNGAGAGAGALPAPPEAVSVSAGVVATTSFRVLPGANAAASPGQPATSANGPQGALFRIAPSGAARTIWESRTDRPLSLAMLRDERLLLGTGDRGRVYRITRDGEITLLFRVDSEQVTAAVTEGGVTLLGASNPGRVLELSGSPRTEGSYRSRVLDAGGASRFGRISWDVRTSPGSAVSVETRTGNSEEPDDTWSDWVAAAADAAIASPAARFLQWRAILRSDGSASPELASLEAAYLPVNLAPRVTGITLHPAGLAFEELLNSSAPRVQGMERRPDVTDAARRGQTASALPVGSGRQLYLHGVRTATFRAEDPNGDRLRYRISYRRQGDVPWQPLRSGLSESIVAWDTSTMPDGRYELRVEVEDSPDNPPGESLTGTRVSRPFTVDNTPPVISDLTVTADGAIRFRASDSGSPIRRASVSVDGGPAQVVRPVDGIADSPSEDYDSRLGDFPEGAGSVVVKVEDDMGNWGAAEARVGS
jgi:hypothetical protein